MKYIDKTVIKETKYIAICVVVMSIVMEFAFFCIGKWDYTVLYGNLLMGIFAILNFFLMGLSVSKSLQKEEKDAKSLMKLSQTYRTLMLAVVLIIGASIPSCFNLWSMIITVLFPGIAVRFRAFIKI